jgi:hypothetical protein
MTKQYLGDSVYAEVVNGMVKLTTENGHSDDPRNTILLEPDTFQALAEYVEKNKPLLMS